MTPIWLFDLDDTLHHASAHIFPRINQAMTDYVARHVGVNEDEANRLREDYWQRYGATLTGLMRHHGVVPQHFLWHTHQFPQLEQQLVFDRAVKSMLRRLPGRKFVFSNSPIHYAEAVLDAMGIRDAFAAVWCIEQLRYTPKPFAPAFRRLLHREGLRPERCVMVEDSTDNLRTAKALGMRTVLISPSPRKPAWVDVRLRSVMQLARLGLGH